MKYSFKKKTFLGIYLGNEVKKGGKKKCKNPIILRKHNKYQAQF